MLILADDLTGSADSAAAFAVRGHQTRVLLAADAGGDMKDPDPGADPNADAAVVSIDLNSRAMPVAAAVAATAAAIKRYTAQLGTGKLEKGRSVFVKIDSTGRGHIRPTVEAVFAALPRRPSRVVVCPAFPTLGRTVVNGWVHVDGEPLPGGDLRDSFSGFPAGSGLLIAAAQTDEDLAALVGSSDDDVLWVGSAGLARHVATRVAVVPHPALPREPAEQVVVVVGSQHRRSIDQLARLDNTALHPSTTRVLRVDPRDRSLLELAKPTIVAADGLVLTGGRTARTVLDLVGITQFDVGGEVEIGVPWAIAEIAGRRIALVTKSGSFGDDDTLQRAVDFLTRP